MIEVVDHGLAPPVQIGQGEVVDHADVVVGEGCVESHVAGNGEVEVDGGRPQCPVHLSFASPVVHGGDDPSAREFTG